MKLSHIPLLAVMLFLPVVVNAADQQVTARDGVVEKNDKIDSDGLDYSLPDEEKLFSKGKIKITSKTFTPPTGYIFASFGNTFVDILFKAPDTIKVHRDLDTATAIKVYGIYIKDTAMDFPLQAEGNLLPIAGGGTGGGGSAIPKHWAAMVPKVKLVVLDGTTVITPPDPDPYEAYITPDPAMPQLTAHLEPLGLTGDVKWRFEVTYDSHTRDDDDKYPKKSAKVLPYGTPWDIIADMGKDFRGGDATVTAIYNNITFKLKFEIDGKNATKEAVGAYVNDKGAPPYARAIIDQESKFRQFYALGDATNAGEPIFGAPNGWGLSQIDNTGDPTLTIIPNWLWNWNENVVEGIKIMNQKLKAAINFYNRQVKLAGPNNSVDVLNLNYGGLAFSTQSQLYTPQNALGIQFYNGTKPKKNLPKMQLFSFSRTLGKWVKAGAPYTDYTKAVCTFWATSDQ